MIPRNNQQTVRRLFKLVAPEAPLILLATVLGLATISSSVGLLSLGAWIISMASLQPSIAELQIAIVGVRFFGISRGVFRYLERLISHRVSLSLLADIRVWFYQRIEVLAPARLQQYRTGDILSRINHDIETLQDFYVRVISLPLVFFLSSSLIVAFAFSLMPAIGLISMAGYLIAGLLLPILLKKQYRRLSGETKIYRAKLNSSLIDLIQGNVEILSLNSQASMKQQIKLLDRGLTEQRKKIGHLDGLDSAFQSFLTGFTMLAALFIAIGQIDDIMLAPIALGIIASFESVAPMTRAMKEFDASVHAGERLFALIDAKPEVKNTGKTEGISWHPDIEIKDLTFSYPDSPLPVLSDISISVSYGERIAIIGPGGAGKTTLGHLLLRFWDYHEGGIQFDGQDIRQFSPEYIRQMISTVSQQTYLFNSTIKENLLLAKPNATSEELNSAINQAGLEEFISTLPKGIETLIGESGAKISGGERQRIAIAQAWLKESPILLLDEPISHLDALNEKKILKSLASLMNQRTTILITHRLSNMEIFDRIFVMMDGKIVESGSEAELIRLNGVYTRLKRLQNR